MPLIDHTRDVLKSVFDVVCKQHRQCPRFSPTRSCRRHTPHPYRLHELFGLSASDHTSPLRFPKQKLTFALVTPLGLESCFLNSSATSCRSCRVFESDGSFSHNVDPFVIGKTRRFEFVANALITYPLSNSRKRSVLMSDLPRSSS